MIGKKPEYVEYEEVKINDQQAAELLAHALKLGATGEFPEGKVAPEDEGELKLGVTHKDKNVVIVFGKPVAWLSMPSGVARSLAQAMIGHADKVDREALIKEGEVLIEEGEVKAFLRCQEEDETGAQCLLMDGHDGIHRFRDDTVAVWKDPGESPGKE